MHLQCGHGNISIKKQQQQYHQIETLIAVIPKTKKKNEIHSEKSEYKRILCTL